MIAVGRLKEIPITLFILAGFSGAKWFSLRVCRCYNRTFLTAQSIFVAAPIMSK